MRRREGEGEGTGSQSSRGKEDSSSVSTLDTDLDMVRPSSALAYYHETDEKGSKYTSEQRKSMPVGVEHFAIFFGYCKLTSDLIIIYPKGLHQSVYILQI